MQMGTIHPGSFTVVPLEKGKKTSKFAAADDSTTIQAYEYKKGNLTKIFQTERIDKEITRLIHTGGNGKYNLFAASGQTIRGVNKKGKEFFKFETNHTETINHLTVQGTELWSCGDFILNNYGSGKDGIQDKFYYICEDKINDMMVQHVGGEMINNTILACEDGTIRALTNNEVKYSQKVGGSPACMFDGSTESQRLGRSTPSVFYGAANGEFG